MNLIFNFQMATPHLEHLDEWIKERQTIIQEITEGKTGTMAIKAETIYDKFPARDRDALMWQEIVWKQWEDAYIEQEEIRRRNSYERMIEAHRKRLAERNLPVPKIEKMHKVVIYRSTIHGKELAEIIKKGKENKNYTLIHFFAFSSGCTLALPGRFEKIKDTVKTCRIKTVYRTIVINRVYIRGDTQCTISNAKDCYHPKCNDYFMMIIFEPKDHFYISEHTYICIRDDIIPVEVEDDQKEMICASEDSDYDTVIELPAVRHAASNVVHPRTTEEMLPGIRDLGWKQYHIELIVSIEFLN